VADAPLRRAGTENVPSIWVNGPAVET
jgi:hypothetical protein